MTLLEFLSTAQAYAAAAAEAEQHEPSINDIWFPLANFIIFAFVIVKFALPLVRDFLKSRREEVLTKINQASAKKRAAEALVQEYRTKLANIDKELQSIQTSLREEGEREKAKLVTEARSMAAKIRQDGNFLADQEVKMARHKVREEIAEQAEATARQLIERNLGPADQSRLVEDFIRTIGQTR